MRGRNRIGRAGALLAVVVTATVVAAPAGNAAEPDYLSSPPYIDFETGPACPGWILYGVRGSGEAPPPADGDVGNDLGLGSTIAAVYRELRTARGAGAVGAAANRYPAVRVREFANDLGYAESVLIGARKTAADVHAIKGLCPRSRISLVGYSQGADVVRRSLSLIELDRIQLNGVYLLGDPNFDASEATVDEHGTFDPALRGVGTIGPDLSRLPRPLAIPDGVPVESWCDTGDVVCQGPAWSDAHFRYDGYAAGIASRIARGLDVSFGSSGVNPGLRVGTGSCPSAHCIELVVQNRGTVPVTVTTVEGQGRAGPNQTCVGVSIAPAQSCAFTTSVDTPWAGERNAVVISHSGPGKITYWLSS